MEVDFLPIVMDSLNKVIQPLPKINEEEVEVSDFTPLKDREGLIKRLWGTRGTRVKKALKAERKAAKAAEEDKE